MKYRARVIIMWIMGSLLWGAIVAEAQPTDESDETDWDFADDYDQPREVKRVNIDIEALQLTPPLADYPETQQEFDQLRKEFFFALTDSMKGREQFAYDTDFLSHMTQFITVHPRDTKALTAKFYLAVYLANTYIGSATGRSLGKGVWEDAIALLTLVESTFPDTWQGKASKAYKFFFLKDTPDTEQKAVAQIMEYRALLPIAQELDSEPEFIAFEKYPDPEYTPLAASLRENIIQLELWWGSLERAEEEFAILIQDYPDLSITYRVKRNIDDAYAYQFHGNLGMKDRRLLPLLINSDDPGIVKQAAASLGNVVIWVGLKALHEGTQERVYEETLSYIDRAMIGDAAEREEMVDLLYRLWHLAVPALLESLDAEDPNRVAFAGECLLYMRNEEIMTAIIEKTRITTDETKKAQLVGLLARMSEPCVPVMRFRECLDDAQSLELYERLVVPALEELQAAQPAPTPEGN